VRDIWTQKRGKAFQRGILREENSVTVCVIFFPRAEQNSNPFSGCCWANFSLLSLVTHSGTWLNFCGNIKKISFFCRCCRWKKNNTIS
jgi:hypothetical protein